MTIAELLEALDGYGLVVTDDDLITQRLADLGMAPDKEIR